MSRAVAMHWYVASVRANQEARALEHLARQGFDAWLPRYRKTRRHARSFQTTVAPLFPGYVFVRLDTNVQRWRSVNGTFGVRSLISQDGEPARLPGAFVESLQMRTDADGIVGPEAAPLPLGSNVRVVAGPFADYVGTLIRLDSRQRVTLLLSMLGGAITASVPSENIASLSA